MKYEKTCAACGSFFITQNEKQKCCSSNCGLALGHKDKKYYTCQYCGTPFWKPDAFRKKYCCKECQKAARHEEVLQRNRNSPPAPLPMVYKRECLCLVSHLKQRIQTNSIVLLGALKRAIKSNKEKVEI